MSKATGRERVRSCAHHSTSQPDLQWWARRKRLCTKCNICRPVRSLAWAGYLRFTGNFHAVKQGVIYRSGQLSQTQFQSRITENGIRTVINFRGNSTGRPWYDEEIKASALTGAQHIDFRLSSGRELTDDQLVKLTALLRDSPRPVLIHCEAGADRSGLAAALYKLIVAKRAPEEAWAQLSFRYGRFPWLRNSTAAMDRTFERVLTRTPAAQIVK